MTSFTTSYDIKRDVKKKILAYGLKMKTEKVRKPLRRKIPGTDGITSDIIKVGRNPVTQPEKANELE